MRIHAGKYLQYTPVSLILTLGDRQNCLPYPEFVLTGILPIKEALKGTDVLTGISY